MPKMPIKVRDFMNDREDRMMINDGKAEFVSKTAAEKADVVVCMRVANAHVITEGSIIMPCSECGEMCYRSPSSPKNVKLMCMECAMPMIEREKLKAHFKKLERGNRSLN